MNSTAATHFDVLRICATLRFDNTHRDYGSIREYMRLHEFFIFKIPIY